MKKDHTNKILIVVAIVFLFLASVSEKHCNEPNEYSTTKNK